MFEQARPDRTAELISVLDGAVRSGLLTQLPPDRAMDLVALLDTDDSVRRMPSALPARHA